MNRGEIAEFYAARDARTVQYGGLLRGLQTEVNLVAGDAAATRPGQVALLGLANMIARTHRYIAVDVTSAPLLAASMIPAATIEDAVAAMVCAINPAALLTINGMRIDTNEIDDGDHDRVSIGLGGDPAVHHDVWLGWSGGRGHLSTRPVACGDTDIDILGAATAACLGAGALFHLSHGRQVLPVVINLAERTSAIVDSQHEADSMSAFNGVGTESVIGAVDAGDIIVVGAGAVAHGLGWWARQLGHRGNWKVLDRDIADLPNASRCLGMNAADAGWPAGLPGGKPRAKADILAEMIGAEPVRLWFDEWSTDNPPRSDLVLVLANERGVRADVAALGEPILLHATTSLSWSAQLHRHMPEVDDCPACRIPDEVAPAFVCSTGPAGPEPESSDAALPFLSAAAGLMLAVALQQLSPGQKLLTGRHNHWRLCFEQATQLCRSVHSRPCPHTLPAVARRTIQSGQPRRHDHLDIANR